MLLAFILVFAWTVKKTRLARTVDKWPGKDISSY